MITKTLLLRALLISCCYLIAVQSGFSQIIIDEDSTYYAQKRGQSLVAGNKTIGSSVVASTNNGFINRAFDASGKYNTTSSPLVSCYFPPDNSYQSFIGNDDGSIGPIALPFSFNLYGISYNQIYINNNGNITFQSPISTFSSSGFPFNVPMVAPFWADVDTRAGATVKFKVNSSNVIVTWPGVGYYPAQTNLLNTFQLIISNGNDPLIGIGNNVAFYYRDMQWTTGSASGGSGGFGGTPATVGINKGDNVNYIQVGRFNLNNSNYDGPLGANDGIHYLDNQCYLFNTGNFGNLPPTVSGNPPNNTIDIPCGQTRVISLQALPPEVGQSVSATVNTGGLCNTTVSTTSGATANATVTITGTSCNQGTNIVSFTFTDNFNPSASTTVNISVNVTSCCVPPNISCPQNITVSNTSGQCGANVNFAATATGNSPTITYSHQPGSFFPVGTTTVIVNASNNCNNSSCTFTVTVTDNEAPSISCAAAQTQTADPGVCNAWVAVVGPATGDNCGVANVTNSYNNTADASGTYPEGTTTVTWTVTDINGNRNTCTQDITVTDNEAPSITCEAAQTQTADAGVCNALVTVLGPVTGDNCGVASVTNSFNNTADASGTYPVGTTTVTWTVKDIHGNINTCTQNISVTDDEAPVISVSDKLACFADYDFGNSINPVATPTDNCPGVIIAGVRSDALALGDPYPVGTTTITWTATDIHGNVSTATQLVTRNPEINIDICAGITRTIYTGVGPQSVNLFSTATGGIPGYTYSWSPSAGLSSTTSANPTASPTATTTYTLTVTDSRGCSRSLDIIINVLPMSAAICGGSGNNVKFSVCHIPPGNPSNPQNICISVNALNAHLTSGSNGHNNCYLGPCGQQLCFSTTPGAASLVATKSTSPIVENVIITEEPIIEIQQEEFSANAYPNPASGAFNIQVVSKSNEPITVRIMDMNGVVREVNTKLSKTNNISIGNDLRGGTYMAEVTQGNNKQMLKLVKLN